MGCFCPKMGCFCPIFAHIVALFTLFAVFLHTV